MEQKIVYFEKKGKENTGTAINLAMQRAEELGIDTFVLASTRGVTAEKFVDRAPKECKAIVVTHQAGFREKGKTEMSDETKEKLKKGGMEILTMTHALSGVGRGVSRKFDGVTPPELMASTLRMFSQGMKVCVEIAVMAADAGIIDMSSEIMTIGGTGKGADTVAVIKPAHSFDIFDLDVKEIVAMPRDK